MIVERVGEARMGRLFAALAVISFSVHVVVGLLSAKAAGALLLLLRSTRDRFFYESALASILADTAELAWWDRGAVIATALTFVPLFALLYRALKSARRGQIWAWLAWFVPLANLFVPFRLAREIDASALERDPRGPASWTLFLWWVSWLVGRLGGLLSGLAFKSGDGLAAAGLDLGSGIATSLSALLGILLVRRWVFARPEGAVFGRPVGESAAIVSPSADSDPTLEGPS